MLWGTMSYIYLGLHDTLSLRSFEGEKAQKAWSIIRQMRFFYYVARCVLIRHELLCKSPTTLYRKSKRNYRKYCFRQSLLLTTKQQKSLLGAIKQSSLLPAHFSIWKETQTIGFNKFDLSSFLIKFQKIGIRGEYQFGYIGFLIILFIPHGNKIRWGNVW